MTYFNYGELGHISTQCQNSRKTQSGGKVLSLNGAETTRSDNFIRGMCFTNGIPLIYIMYTGATHSFISRDCSRKSNLEISSMVGSMVIYTPTNCLVTTSLLFLNYPLTICGKDFCIDLVYLPINHLDVILGINCFKFNHVHINCFDKSVMFLGFEEGENMMFISAKKMEETLKDDTRVFIMFA